MNNDTSFDIIQECPPCAVCMVQYPRQEKSHAQRGMAVRQLFFWIA